MFGSRVTDSPRRLPASLRRVRPRAGLATRDYTGKALRIGENSLRLAFSIPDSAPERLQTVKFCTLRGSSLAPHSSFILLECDVRHTLRCKIAGMLQWHEKPADRPGSGHTKSPGDAFSAELQPVEETG